MLYFIALVGWMAISVVVLLVLLYTTAPYGKFHVTSWGPLIGNRIGWYIMELPALLSFPLWYMLLKRNNHLPLLTAIILLLWITHYVRRAIIYPLQLSNTHKKMPLSVVGMGVLYNSVNGFFLGYYYAFYTVEASTITSIVAVVRIVGIVMMIAGISIATIHDNILIRLQKNNNGTYIIPTGGLFRYCSTPHFFGEIIGWIGFALLCLSLPALSMLLWTMANLVPRSIHTHRWYQRSFPDYPARCSALIPTSLLNHRAQKTANTT